MTGPYGREALGYFKSGFKPIPVKRDKTPLVSGYHGREAHSADAAQIHLWMEKFPDANIALVLPRGYIGLDVDAYGDKDGEGSLSRLESEFGHLPPTVFSTSREDGISGIRLFRIPAGYEELSWPGKAGDGIELITEAERYLICWPSVHGSTGLMYRWWLQTPDGSVPVETLNGVLIPELPVAMADGLARVRDDEERGAVGDIRTWIAEYGAGKPCEMMGDTSARWVELIPGGAHDAARDGIRAILGDAVAGHPGGSKALSRLRAAFLDEMGGRDAKRRSTAVSEWRRMARGGVELAAGRVERDGKADGDPCEVDSFPVDEATGKRGLLEPFSVYSTGLTRWRWHRFVAEGDFSLLDADPGDGKSLMSIDVSSRFSVGREMPDGTGGTGEPVNCLILAPEDRARVQSMRISAAGGNTERIYRPKMEMTERGKVMFRGAQLSFPASLRLFRDMLIEYDIGFVVLDPIAAFMDESINTNNDASVRRALEPMVMILGELGCSALGLRHLNKDGSMDAKYRGGGSTAFAAVSRIHLFAGKLPEEHEGVATRGLSILKNNHLERKPKESLTYSIESSDIEADEEGNMVPVIGWHGYADISADDLTNAKRGPEPVMQDAMTEVLEEMFAERDTWPSKEVESALRGAGCSTHPREMTKVKKRLGITSIRLRRRGTKDIWVMTTDPYKQSISG